jgi:hypothetical protein
MRENQQGLDVGEKSRFVIANVPPGYFANGAAMPTAPRTIAFGMVAEHIYRISNFGPGILAVSSTRRGNLVQVFASATCDVQTQPPEDLQIFIAGGDFVAGTFERLD